MTIDINKIYIINKNITCLKNELYKIFSHRDLKKDEFIVTNYYILDNNKYVSLICNNITIILKLDVKDRFVEDDCDFIKILDARANSILTWSNVILILEIFDNYFNLTEELEENFIPAY